MTREEIRQVVLEELANLAPESDPASLRGDADIRETLDLDSMDFLNLLIALHQRLNVAIPDEDAGKLATLDNALDYLVAAGA